jgi:cysteine-rich repeat protein
MRRLAFSLAALFSVGACGGDDASTGEDDSTGTSAGPSSGGDTPETMSDPTNVSLDSTGDSTCGDACPGTTTSATESSTGSATAVDSSGSSTTEPAESSDESPEESSSSEGSAGDCGNGAVDGDEECDEAGESATCDDDCTFVDCGDENINQAAGEICDEGGESFNCDADCTLPVCGDSIVNESHNETCDDGGETVSCDNNCTPVGCGDGTQNLAALESCDDGNNVSDDGCSGTCVLEGDFGGTCRVVDGTQWCFDDDSCGQACDDVCSALGLTIEPNDATWFAAQDSLAECQAISDAFGIAEAPNFGDHPLGCLEDEGLNDLVGYGLTGSLFCSSDPACPAAHRTDMDALGTNCNIEGARRSVCPCAGEFCGNGVVEGVEECDDGNDVSNDGCTTGCSTTPPTCVEVNGQLWCFDNDACGEACNDVCAALGFDIEITDDEWFQLQDEISECQDIADAFGMPGIDVNSYAYACLEDSGAGDIVGGGLTGSLLCSTYNGCPFDHRTQMDGLGTACGVGGARRSICPCG